MDEELCRGCENPTSIKNGAKICFYGGLVCCRSCDWEACMRMESSMPGAGPAKSPGQLSMQRIRDNWDCDD